MELNLKKYIAPRGAFILTKYSNIEIGPPPPNEKGIVDTRREGGWSIAKPRNPKIIYNPYYQEACGHFTNLVWDETIRLYSSDAIKYNKNRAKYISTLDKEIENIEKMPYGPMRDAWAYWADYFYNIKIEDFDRLFQYMR